MALLEKVAMGLSILGFTAGTATCSESTIYVADQINLESTPSSDSSPLNIIVNGAGGRRIVPEDQTKAAVELFVVGTVLAGLGAYGIYKITSRDDPQA